MENSFIKKLVTHIDKFIESFEREKLLEKGKKQDLGIIYSPNQVVEYIVSNIFKIYFSNFITFNKETRKELNLEKLILSISNNPKVKENLVKIVKKIRVLDPSCGSGRFLIVVAEKLYQDKILFI